MANKIKKMIKLMFTDASETKHYVDVSEMKRQFHKEQVRKIIEEDVSRLHAAGFHRLAKETEEKFL